MTTLKPWLPCAKGKTAGDIEQPANGSFHFFSHNELREHMSSDIGQLAVTPLV